MSKKLFHEIRESYIHKEVRECLEELKRLEEEAHEFEIFKLKPKDYGRKIKNNRH